MKCKHPGVNSWSS